MNRTHIFDFCLLPGRLKKSLNFRGAIKCFFRPVTFLPRFPHLRMSTAVVGTGILSKPPFFSPLPATVPFFRPRLEQVGPPAFRLIDRCLSIIHNRLALTGRFRLVNSFAAVQRRSGLFFFLCHFLKEYIVTITNHIRRIEELAASVLEHVDARRYPEAHIALDDIESKCHSARAHLIHLQDVLPPVHVPKGD